MNIRKETDSEKDNLSSFTTIDLKKQKKEARQAAKLTKRKAYQDLSFRKKALYWGMRVIGAVAVCGLVLIIGVFCMNPILTLVDDGISITVPKSRYQRRKFTLRYRLIQTVQKELQRCPPVMRMIHGHFTFTCAEVTWKATM